MAGPVHTLRRALLPLNCGGNGGGGELRGGFGFARDGGSGFPAAAAGGGGGGAGSGSVSGGVTGRAVAGMNATHDSLIKVLLRVGCIQPEVRVALCTAVANLTLLESRGIATLTKQEVRV